MEKIKTKKNAFKKFCNFHWSVKLTLILFFLFFLVEAIIELYPFIWVINNSLKGNEFYETSTELTRTFEFRNYVKIFTEFKSEGAITAYYFTMLWNSIWQTAVFLFVNLLSSMLVAYALAKFRFPGKGFLYGLLIFTQTIPIIGTGAAAFKLRYALGMINNPFTIWYSWASGFDYSAFILFGAFLGVSNSYSESAKLDGANEFQIFGRVVFPQVFPVIVALLVTNFVGKWNDYTTSQINLTKYPSLAFGLFTYRKASSYGIKGVYYAATVMTALPGVLLYAIFQNLIIKNVSVGGLKG